MADGVQKDTLRILHNEKFKKKVNYLPPVDFAKRGLDVQVATMEEVKAFYPANSIVELSAPVPAPDAAPAAAAPAPDAAPDSAPPAPDAAPDAAAPAHDAAPAPDTSLVRPRPDDEDDEHAPPAKKARVDSEGQAGEFANLSPDELTLSKEELMEIMLDGDADKEEGADGEESDEEVADGEDDEMDEETAVNSDVEMEDESVEVEEVEPLPANQRALTRD